MTLVSLGQSVHASGGGDIFLTGVQDILIDATFAQPIIYVATGSGGAGLSVWSVDQTLSVRVDIASYPGGVQLGQPIELSLMHINGQATLATIGINDAGIWAYEQGKSGAISKTGYQPMSGLPNDLKAVTTGGGLVFGAHSNSQKIEVWDSGSTGEFTNLRKINSGLENAPSGIIKLTHIEIGDPDILLALTDGEDTLGSYTVDKNGRPTLVNTYTVSDGVGIAGASNLDVVQMAGRSYAIVTGRDSNTLTVFEIGSGGGIVARDHLIDTGDTRFGGAAHLAISTIGDSVFVAAAGNDDGISLFQLLPGGRLLHLSTQADTAEMTLENISALDMASSGETLIIAVTSETEVGLTIFDSVLGPQGITLTGTDINATLRGTSDDDVIIGGVGSEYIITGGGNDVLMDGAGSDTLSGGDGTDVFILATDGAVDTIIGFQVGIDQIDLSGWTFLRNSGQLTFTSLTNGGQIAFRDETLRIETRSQTPITSAHFTEMSILEGDRILPEWFEQVNAQLAESTGTSASDVITGGAGRDLLKGGAGNDTLMGSAGNDHIDGGSGGDYLNGGPGSDLYIVDSLDDRVIESRRWEGQDTVESGVDFWLSGVHVEDLLLTGYQDIRGVGNGLVNLITGNDGNNILDGGKNNDQLIGGNGNDTYYVRAPLDTVTELENGGTDVVKAYRSLQIPENVERMYLQGTINLNGIGNDQANLIVGNMADNMLIGRGGRDTLKGLGGADTFVFDRAPGNENVDRIIDFTTGEDNLWIKATLFGLDTGNVQTGAFHLGPTAHDINDRFIFDTSTGGLWIDPDGTGPQRQILTFVLEADAVLTASDIFIF
jgi:Ca2+-binding RTX toxin-like protein